MRTRISQKHKLSDQDITITSQHKPLTKFDTIKLKFNTIKEINMKLT